MVMGLDLPPSFVALHVARVARVARGPAALIGLERTRSHRPMGSTYENTRPLCHYDRMDSWLHPALYYST